MFAKGKKSRGICDRCGWEYPYLKLRKEMGTQLTVCSECHDGAYDRVLHPQNYAPRDLTDNIALRNPRPDTETEVQGIFVYGETSNGFGTDYVGTFIIEA